MQDWRNTCIGLVLANLQPCDTLTLMETPNFFMFKSRVDVDTLAGAAHVVEQYVSADIATFPLNDSLGLVAGLYYPVLPQWRPWRDGLGGTVHTVEVGHPTSTESEREDIATAAHDLVTGDQLSAFSTDGTILRNGEPHLITYGINESSVITAIWAVANATIEELAAAGDDIALSFIGEREDYWGVIPSLFDKT